jgi:hypothetical protein
MQANYRSNQIKPFFNVVKLVILLAKMPSLHEDTEKNTLGSQIKLAVIDLHVA